jgi:capsular polysaccharide biosynthesis protein
MRRGWQPHSPMPIQPMLMPMPMSMSDAVCVPYTVYMSVYMCVPV